MTLRAACLFLFSGVAMALTGCQGTANPLGGATRMIQAMGRSVGLVSDASKTDSPHHGQNEKERGTDAHMQEGAPAESASPTPSSTSENRFAFAR